MIFLQRKIDYQIHEQARRKKLHKRCQKTLLFIKNIMSKKNNNSFSCIECGSVYSKWVGKCTSCNGWNTIIEEKPVETFGRVSASKESPKLEALHGEIEVEDRIISNSLELDRVLGGGIVLGSSILIGGEPGVGKSTLLLSLAIKLAKDEARKIIYISGEESVNQIRLRAKRMETENSNLKITFLSDLGGILNIMSSLGRGDVLIIDSIQTITAQELPSAAGSIAQVRACADEILQVARNKEISVFLIGHINKEGQIAGPKVLEHMVDVVLYFEEDRGHQFRVLRNIKNRFGSVQETGIFKMHEKGLIEIPNPSALFLSKKTEDKIGNVVFAGIEGTRPMMLEVETLLAPSFMSFPKRTAIGWDSNRLSMIIAILTSHLKAKLHEKEIYLNIAGGLKTGDPSVDFAVIISIFSALFEIPVKTNIASFGEVSLSGELRPVQFAEGRIKEAIKLGYTTILCPPLEPEMKYLLKLGDIIEMRDIKTLKHIIK